MIATNKLASLPLFEIGEIIATDWVRPYFGARPYIEALGCLTTDKSVYGCEPADMIIDYFLCNAGQWRGDVARAVKSELKRRSAAMRAARRATR